MVIWGGLELEDTAEDVLPWHARMTGITNPVRAASANDGLKNWFKST